MKKNILSLLLLLFTFTLSFAQQEKDYLIKEGPLKFTIPNDQWMPLPKQKGSKGTMMHFKRLGVKDSVGRKAFPEIMIIVEQVPPNTELTKYSLSKQKPYQTLKNYKTEKVFTESDGMLRLHYAVGNKARYEDANGVKHTFYFIHAIKNNKGIQAIIDIPSDLFDSYEEELTSVIRSLE